MNCQTRTNKTWYFEEKERQQREQDKRGRMIAVRCQSCGAPTHTYQYEQSNGVPCPSCGGWAIPPWEE